MTQNIKRSICLTPGMLEELQIFASSKNITVAEAIRYLLERGLSLTMFTEEQDTIRRFIREEIENTLAVTMKQYMDRLIKMQAVTTRVSSAALQCNVAVLAENYIDQATPEEILANALRQSCRITRTKPKSDAEYIADVFDAMTTDRPYRKGLPLEYAVREIETGAGSQFDPQLARTFARLLRSRSIPLSPQAAARYGSGENR